MEYCPIFGNTLHRDTAYHRNKKKKHDEFSTGEAVAPHVIHQYL